MIYDGIVTYAVIKELNNKIISGRIEKISMPTNLEIDIYIYAGQKYILKIDCNPSSAKIYISNNKKNAPLVPPTFCMVLRKHLEGSKITAISQYNLDRIIQIEFETLSEMNDIEKKSLIIELMGKHSNCIFVDKDNIIIDSLKHITPSISSVRNVLPNLPYIYPVTKNNILQTNIDSFCNNIQNNADQNTTISDYLINTYNGFSKAYVNLILNIANISIATLICNLDKNHIYNIYESIQNTINSINEKRYNMNNNYLIFNTDYTTSINEFLDKHYTNLENTNRLLQIKNNLIKQLSANRKKLIGKLKTVENNLKECSNMDKYKLFGELLSANIYKLKEKTDSVTVQNYYNNNQDITITLDKKLTPQQNSQKYFKKYAKLKNTYSYSLPEKEKLQNEVEYIDSIIYSIETCDNANEIIDIEKELVNQKYIKDTEKRKQKQKQNTEKQDIKDKLEKHIFQDYIIYVGKNNIQNEYIAHKLGKDNDIWLHVQKAPGSHVIIQNSTNLNIPNNVIEYAASLAASHSKLKNDSKVNIDYCDVKYVKKHPSNKPGLVIYANFSTITVKPM